MKNIIKRAEEIKENGMSNDEWKKLEARQTFKETCDPHFLVGYIEHLKKNNDALGSTLERIASGFLTSGESKNIAQYAIDLSKYENLKNNGV